MGVHASTTPTDLREQMANPVVSVAVRNTSPRCVLLGAGNPIGRNGSREKDSQDEESDDFLDDSSADKTGGSHHTHAEPEDRSQNTYISRGRARRINRARKIH